jgi:hypothetical protein
MSPASWMVIIVKALAVRRYAAQVKASGNRTQD